MTHSKGHRSRRSSSRRAGREGGHKTEQDEAAAATATWTALGCGQVQSSLMSLHMPHATCHNCNVPSCNAPIVVSSVLVKYVLPACGCPDLTLSLSLSLSLSVPDTHLAAVLLPMTVDRAKLCAYLVTLCLCFPLPLPPACLIIKMTKYLEKIINFVCMFEKNNIAQI